MYAKSSVLLSRFSKNNGHLYHTIIYSGMYSTKTGLLIFLLVVFGLLIIRFLLQTLGFSYKEGLSIPSVSSIKDKASSAVSTVKDAVTTAAPVVQQAATQVQQAASTAGGAVTTAVKQATPAVQQAASAVGGAVTGAVKQATPAVQQAASGAGGAVTGAVKQATPAVQQAATQVKQTASAVGGAVTGALASTTMPPMMPPTETAFVPYEPPSSTSNCDTLQTFERIANLAVSTMKEIYGQRNPATQVGSTYPVTGGTSSGMANKAGVTVQVTN